MTAISASQVKALRERTGAGMMECKKALVATNGDIEAAIDKMRAEGQAKAVKKADRTAAEGIITIKASDDGKTAVMLEVNCETDFVARDEHFVRFCDKVAYCALHQDIDALDTVMNLPIDGDESDSVDQAKKQLINTVGENVNVRRLTIAKANDQLGLYVHGNRIGVMVHMTGGDAELAKDIAMHIAAVNPQVINPDQVDQATLEREKTVAQAQAAETGKPAQIVEKMVQGRIRKFLDEISLLGQPFVKDPSSTIKQLLAQHQATVTAFTRFEVGEGIEKVKTDFREEVMAQAKSSTAS